MAIKKRLAGGMGFAALLALSNGWVAGAQSCTTQAKLAQGVRDGLTDAALAVASAVKSGDTAKVQSLASVDIAGNFGPTGYLVRVTAEKIAADSLRLTQLYELDANSRAAGDPNEADFSCPLTGTSSETDFGISGLPPGLYAFALVEATGPRPWLLALLLRQESGVWKLAGFYPHARSVAAHDGLWYWTDARSKAKAGQTWLAWLEFGEADDLLRPANFVSSTHLDKLRTERSAAAPPELRDGLSAETPYSLKAADGAIYPITSLGTEGSDDGQRLNMVLHFRADALADPAAARARNLAAAKALLSEHPELRSAVGGVAVFADVAGQPPFATVFGLDALS